MLDRQLLLRWATPYALINFARDCVNVFVVSFYFLYLFSVHGMSYRYLVIMILSLKVFDILKEPILGFIMDKLSYSLKKDKFKFFILTGGISTCSITFVMFNIPDFIGQNILYIIAPLLLIVYMISYSFIDLSVISLCATFGSSARIRETVSAISRGFSVLGFCFTVIMCSYIFAKNPSLPSGAFSLTQDIFSRASAIVCIILAIFTFMFVCTFKDSYQPRKVLNFVQCIKAFFGNDQLMITFSITILQQISLFVFAVTHGYFVLLLDDLPSNKDMFIMIQLPWVCSSLISFLYYSKLVSAFSRKSIFIASLAMTMFATLTLVIISYFGSVNPVILAILMSIATSGYALNLASTTVMTADCVDYGEFKFSCRSECMNFSVQSMSLKIGTMFAVAIAGVSFSYADIFCKKEAYVDRMYSINICEAVIVVCSVTIAAIYLTSYMLHGSFFENILNSLNLFKDKTSPAQNRAKRNAVRYALDEHCVIYKMRAKNLDEVIKILTDRLYSVRAITSRHEFLEGIYKKLNENPAGIGHGIAIPHARGTYVKRPALAVASLTEKMDCGSADNQDCDLIFMIAVPDDGISHISLIGNLSLMLSEPGFANKLRQSGSSEEITRRLIACERNLFN